MIFNKWRTKLAKFRNYTFQGWLRYIRLKLTGKKVRIEGGCAMCGRCCNRISLEANGRWLTSVAQFERLIDRNPEFSRFSPVDRDDCGFLLFTCSWYSDNGVCRDHENRLGICRDFPHTSLYFSGANVPRGCGYRFKAVVPFTDVLQQEMNEHQKKETYTDN